MIDFKNTSVDSERTHLGDLLWWTLSSVKISPEDLKNLLITNGFDKSRCPKFNRDTTLNRICRAREKKFDEHILKQISHDTNEETVTWGVYREIKENKKKMKLQQVASFTLYEKTNGFDYEAIGDTEIYSNIGINIGQQIETIYRQWDNLLSDQEVRPVLMRLLKESMSITVREAGGVYFVPSKKSNYARGLYNIIKGIGSSQAFIFAIYDDEMSRQNLQQAIEESIENEIKRLHDDIDTFTKDTRRSTADKRLKDFQELRSKATLYQEMLQYSQNNLEQRVTEMEKVAKAKLITIGKPELTVEQILEGLV